MIGTASLHRLRTRTRKFYRDPVAFAIDLPNPVLGLCLRGWIVLGLALWDIFDLETWLARAEWAVRGVKARRVSGSEFVSDWAFTDENGHPPARWPRRVMVDADCHAMVSALGTGENFLSGGEVGHRRRVVIEASRRAFGLRAYALDGGDVVLRAGPASSIAILWSALGRHEGFDQALKRAWPMRPRPTPTISTADYRRWLDRGGDVTVLPTDRERAPGLRVSVLMPVKDPPIAHLEAAIRSVLDQDHTDLELCIADDGSRSSEVRDCLQRSLGDPRVRLISLPQSSGIAAATNAALGLASGQVAAFMDHDDLLAPHALGIMARAFADPAVQVAYSDEDTVDAVSARSDPVFKAVFNRERLLTQNVLNHLLCVRLDLLRDVGGLAAGFDGSQDHDLLLRLSERVSDDGFRHVPTILYHWRSYPGGRSFSQTQRARASDARRRAIQAHLDRMGFQALAKEQSPAIARVQWHLPEPPPRVAVIIPTCDRADLLGACVAGLQGVTDYPDIRLIIVDNGRGDAKASELIERLRRDPDVSVLREPGTFDHSGFNNRAAQAAEAAQVLILLNDDILILEPGWLKEMVSLAIRPEIGAVGAKLFYPDGRIQHAGVVVGVGRDRVAGHELRGASADTTGAQSRLLVTREVDAVTAGCLAIERRKFLAVGGFDAERFPISFNDVDLCLRLEAAGYRTIWTPYARLIHAESASRGKALSPEEVAQFEADVSRMRDRWSARLDASRDHHPALSRDDESPRLREPG